MNKIDVACIIDDDPIFVFGAKRMMELSDFCDSFMVFKNGGKFKMAASQHEKFNMAAIHASLSLL